MKILDTHQHLIYPERFRYSWCRGIEAFAGQAFRLEEYREAARGTGIDRTLFMEADVDEPDMKSEAEFFQRLASVPASGIAGVIAACRPEREDFLRYVESIRHPKLKGLRRVWHTQPDATLQSPQVVHNLARLAPYRLPFDLCVLPGQLPLATTLAQSVPAQVFVLDHCGIPNIKAGELDPWRKQVRALSRLPNVSCKVSGVVAYCSPDRVAEGSIRPFVEHCCECFGWDRVLFGGDWPVCNLTATLGRWVEIAKELVAGESSERQAKFFAGNAERIYGIEG